MKKILVLVIGFILGLSMISCTDETRTEAATEISTELDAAIIPLNNMSDLDSYKAVMTIKNQYLDIDREIWILYNEGETVYYFHSDFPMVYKEVDGELKLWIWMETQYYIFDVPEDDIINIFNFEDLSKKDITERADGGFSIDDLEGVNFFKYFVSDGLISEIGFTYNIKYDYTIQVDIKFEKYNEMDFTNHAVPNTPTERQYYFYDFYVQGYEVVITDGFLDLHALNYLVSISLRRSNIKIQFNEAYLEINPDTKDIAVVTINSHTVFSFYDFFRLNPSFEITKEDVNDYIELFNTYKSIYPD